MNNQNITSVPLEDFELGMLTWLSSVKEETEIDDNADAAGLRTGLLCLILLNNLENIWIESRILLCGVNLVIIFRQ